MHVGLSKIVTLLALIAFVWLAAAFTPPGKQPQPYPLQLPTGWPQPVYDLHSAPPTIAGVELGRQLFYDPILSADSTISCSSCHLSYTAFTHVDHALSHGVADSIGTRNSPALMNLAWSTSFMWDGAVNHLDVQALAPIAHKAEMRSSIAEVVQKLHQLPSYRQQFFAAFGDSAITGQYVLKALAQFQLTLISANSTYDKVMRGEAQFSPQEANGYAVFKSHCASCHAEPLFTTGEFANNGLPVDSALMDAGRATITQQASDSLTFKIPTLRNIEFSFPYMHDGRFKRLGQVLKHYTAGITNSPTLAPQLRGGIPLSETERLDVLAFLLTLSDREFCFNPAFAAPRPAPTTTSTN